MNDNRPGTSKIIIGQKTGLLRIGTIQSYDPSTNAVSVILKKPFQGPPEVQNVQLPVAVAGIKNGMFIGSYPEKGTPVVIAQGEGGPYYFVSYLPKDVSVKNTTQPTNLPTLNPDELLIQSDANNTIRLNVKKGITIGIYNNSLNMNTQKAIYINNFDNAFNFFESSRKISGIIKRDRKPRIAFSSVLSTKSLEYDDQLITIGLDPIYGANNVSNDGTAIRNPPRVETRELIFEYAESAKVLSDDVELTGYLQQKTPTFLTDINVRRDSRADALSLSLIFPNALIETIKGTVVDLYGNILDINRKILPIGQTDDLSATKIKTTASDKNSPENVYKGIKELERRSIAYHFEINTRKNVFGPPDILIRDNFARDRSRFFIDVDKEGLFKLNVPASSETGNIPLLTRYENYSTVNPNDKSKDPNDLVYNSDYIDILQESFNSNYLNNSFNGIISIEDGESAPASPIDRFSDLNSPTHIKHGMVYHNILNTLSAFHLGSIYKEPVPTTPLGRGLIPILKDIVSTTIINKGVKANAGGRSGSLNFDGSLEVNIGANTVDRDSLWIDTQGAVKANIGRDIVNDLSVALHADGGIFIQSGGTTIANDSRFKSETSKFIAGVLDIRVYNEQGGFTSVRIDRFGVSMSTPSMFVVSADQGIQLRSRAKIDISAPEVRIQNRKVNREGNSL